MPKPKPESIITLLQRKPGCKASYLAGELGCTRKEVNSVLYGSLKSDVVKDCNYLWYLASETGIRTGDAQPLGKAAVEKEISKIPGELSLKPVDISTSSIRGNSLFHFELFPDGIKVRLNEKHPFVSREVSRLDSEGLHRFNLLLETFAQVLELHYTDADLFEEVVDDWGSLLIRRLS